MSAAVLTMAQAAELRRLLKGRQPTYGASRARVQNNLYYRRRYVRFIDIDGNYVSPHVMGMSALADWCEITDEGRKALAEYDTAKTRKRA